MSYKEKEVVAKYTKGNYFSDCGEYNVKDLLEMFDLAMVTKNELGDFELFNVNQCVSDSNRMLINLVVTSEVDDMFCYVNKDTKLQNEADRYFIEAKHNLIDESSMHAFYLNVPCSLELDYEFQYQSE